MATSFFSCVQQKTEVSEKYCLNFTQKQSTVLNVDVHHAVLFYFEWPVDLECFSHRFSAYIGLWMFVCVVFEWFISNQLILVIFLWIYLDVGHLMHA